MTYNRYKNTPSNHNRELDPKAYDWASERIRTSGFVLDDTTYAYDKEDKRTQKLLDYIILLRKQIVYWNTKYEATIKEQIFYKNLHVQPSTKRKKDGSKE